MSQTSPRLRSNANRYYQQYWCYRCDRTVTIASRNSSDIMCPRCFGQFLSEITIVRPRLVVDYTDFDPSPQARLLEALSLMLDPPLRRRYNNPLFNEADHEIRGRRGPWQGYGHGHGNYNLSEGLDHLEPEQELRGGPQWRRRRNRSLDDQDPEINTRNRPRSWIIITPIDRLSRQKMIVRVLLQRPIHRSTLYRP